MSKSQIALMILMSLVIVQCQAKDDKPKESNSNQQFEELKEMMKNSSSMSSGNVDFVAAAALSTPCVVHIMSKVNVTTVYRSPFGSAFDKPRTSQRESSGSGVIVAGDGYIVTNYHVIKDATSVEVILRNKNAYKATIVGTDKDTDLALLKIEEKELPFMDFANSDDVKVGEWVLAVGNPFNLESTVTQGIVSAKGRSLNLGNNGNTSNPIESFIQTDAAVNPGNSGGALVNLKGQLIGINTAIASPTGAYAGYAFAVPSNIVKKIVSDLKQYKTVQRAYLGINAMQLTSDISKKLNLKSPNGVLVGNVIRNSAAHEAKLNKYDVIVSIDDNDINSFPELLEVLSTHSPGDKISIKYYRDGELNSTNAILKNKNNSTEMLKALSDDSNTLGVQVSPMSMNEKQKYGIPYGLRIQNISREGAIAKNTNIKKGFVMMTINGVKLNDENDLQEAISTNGGMVDLEGFYPGQQFIVKYKFKI